MNLTVITLTGDRPEAFALAEKWLARQTLQPVQVLVLDDGKVPTVCTQGQDYHYWPECQVGKESLVRKMRRAIRDDMIKGDAVVFWEDDDYYAPDYLEWVAASLAKHTLVGEARALYYNVRDRFWYEHQNGAPAERNKPKHSQHASLCSTSIRKDGFVWLAKQCAISAQPFLDVRLWNRAPFPGRILLADPYAPGGKRRTVGIKGCPGRTGYGMGHGERDRAAKDDFDLAKLRELIGDDCEAYAGFWQPKGGQTAPEAAKPVELAATGQEQAIGTLATATIVVEAQATAEVAVPATETPVLAPGPQPEAQKPAILATKPAEIAPIGNSPFAKGHGPNWWKWLRHLRDRPIISAEFGTFRGESAEWFMDNIAVHPQSAFHCVDPFKGSLEHRLHKIDVSTTEADARKRLERFGDKVRIHVGTSDTFCYAMRPMVRDGTTDDYFKLDSLYIDGAHDSPNVLRDSILGFDLLRVGGIMIWDDVLWTEVPQEIDRPKLAIDAFLRIYSREIEVLTPRGWQVAIRKLKDV